ncbi:hypothetical protein [Hyphomonas pacifica]|uniref:Uncharacterized protein n=1 Tax=Hyphomonas pacifica TaxID=1280941 RepID=A0A062U0F0_9PROT|nr:hypothetical protein [Hyphomonas pacifica]KCZ49417.1 hypothetical protein HY2_03250 [Hyphomonas pacifica]RAN33223.1 hypothetical protein HY3_02415 [Hyphomonas pacifica]
MAWREDLYDAFRRRFGRWWVVDPLSEPEPSDTWDPPSAEGLAALKPGDIVSLAFKGWPRGRIYYWEILRVELIAVDGDQLIGRVVDDADDMPQLERGAGVTFRRADILDIDPPDW